MAPHPIGRKLTHGSPTISRLYLYVALADSNNPQPVATPPSLAASAAQNLGDLFISALLFI